MAAEKIDVLLIGPEKPVIAKGLNSTFNVVKLPDANAREKFFSDQAPRIRGMAVAATSERIDGPFMSRFARLEIVSSFGVGYDHIDAAWAGGHGITVTNTPDVLTEEVADTALGLLLCTVREFPQAERYLRSGRLRTFPTSIIRTCWTWRGRWKSCWSLRRAGRRPEISSTPRCSLRWAEKASSSTWPAGRWWTSRR